MLEITRDSRNASEFDDLLFVLRARGDDATRLFSTVLHIEAKKKGCIAVATDGRRLHTAELSMTIESGDYDPLITKDSVILKGPRTDVSYPDWRKVIPKTAEELGVINFLATGLGKKPSQIANLSLRAAYVTEKTGKILNLAYLNDVAKEEWELKSPKGNRKPVILRRLREGRESLAVIMPMEKAA